jgi:hypothetical protein
VARAFCLLITLASLLYSGESFIFSYKVVTAKSVVVYEEKNIALSMVKHEKLLHKTCTLPLQYDFKSSKELFLREHFDVLLECFYSHASHMISTSEQNLKASMDRVELIIEPVYFTVDFKEEFATINTFR